MHKSMRQPLAASDSSFNNYVSSCPGSARSEYTAPQLAVTKKKRKHKPSRAGKATPKKTDGKIPRPQNAFMLWQKEIRPIVQQKCPQFQNMMVSQMLGANWHKMDESDRTPKYIQAEECKKRHAKIYPDYKYSPKKTSTISTKKATTTSSRLSSHVATSKLVKTSNHVNNQAHSKLERKRNTTTTRGVDMGTEKYTLSSSTRTSSYEFLKFIKGDDRDDDFLGLNSAGADCPNSPFKPSVQNVNIHNSNNNLAAHMDTRCTDVYTPSPLFDDFRTSETYPHSDSVELTEEHIFTSSHQLCVHPPEESVLLSKYPHPEIMDDVSSSHFESSDTIPNDCVFSNIMLELMTQEQQINTHTCHDDESALSILSPVSFKDPLEALTKKLNLLDEVGVGGSKPHFSPCDKSEPLEAQSSHFQPPCALSM